MKTRITWTFTGAVPGFGSAGDEQSIELDASVREVPRAAAVVTKHPIEAGADPADNIRPEARTLTIEGWISDAPISEPETQMDGASGERRDGVLQFIGAFDRAKAVSDLLLALLESGTLVTVRSGAALYEGYALTSFEAPRETASGALHFTIEAERIRVVASETVEAPREIRARSRRNRGQQHATEATGEHAAAPSDRGLLEEVSGQDGEALQLSGPRLGG